MTNILNRLTRERSITFIDKCCLRNRPVSVILMTRWFYTPHEWSIMRFIFFFGSFVIGIALICARYTDAQKPSPSQFRQTSKEPPVDLFMGHWTNAKPKKLYGGFEVWDILTKLEGQPLRPNRKSAVLTDLNAVRYAILKPSSSTRPATLKSCQQIFYIVSGEGEISTKESLANLGEGVGVLMPEGVEYTMTNTGIEPLVMYIIEEPVKEGFVPKKDMIVRYEYDNNISTNINRGGSRDWLFSPLDGLATIVSFNPVMFEPESLVPPHVHEPGVEEVWIAVTGNMQIMVGSQQRMLVPGGAYKVPADGITPHANINVTETSKKLLWIMKVPVTTVPAQPEARPRKKNGII